MHSRLILFCCNCVRQFLTLDLFLRPRSLANLACSHPTCVLTPAAVAAGSTGSAASAGGSTAAAEALASARCWSRSNRPDCLNAESSKKAWPLADLPQHVAALQGTLTPQMSDRETGLALDMPARKKAQASIQRRAQHHKALAPLQGAAGLLPKPGP